MKVVLLFIVLFTCAATITGQGFNCYVCDGEGCDQPTEVTYCGPPTGTDTTSTTESSPTVTDSSSDSPTPTDSSSTVTDSSSASPTSTDSSSISTDSSSASPTSTDSSSISTDSSSASPTSTDSSSISTDSSSASPTSTDSSSTTTDPGSANPAAEDSLRQRRSAAAILIRNYRSISRAAGDGYACYSITIKDDDDNSHIRRGCVVIPEEKDGCEAVRDEINQSEDNVSDCKVCQRDRCNGSAAVHISMFVLLAAAILKFVM